MTEVNQLTVYIEKNDKVFSSITPNFIYNRFDIDCNDYLVLDVEGTKLEIRFHDSDAYLGIWLMKIEKHQLQILCEYIFSNYPNIERIHYQFSYQPLGYFKKKNHFRISLPNSLEELSARLSSKGRYNLKREYRIIEQELGPIKIDEYTKSNVPKAIIDKYFVFKEKTHHINYNMTSNEYLDRYHVSDIYVLYAKDILLSMILSCEQCGVVYIENLTYDIEYSKYSAGQVLYDYYLKRLIEKGKKEIYLAGGTLSYKKRYGSIEEIVYHGTIYRNRSCQYFDMVRDYLKSQIKKALGR